MPIIQDPTRAYQHSLDNSHYGELPIEGFPTLSGSANIAYFDGTQWQGVQLVGAGLAEINYDAAAKLLEVYYGSNRIPGSFSGNAVLLNSASATFLSLSVILRTESFTFTADAVLV